MAAIANISTYKFCPFLFMYIYLTVFTFINNFIAMRLGLGLLIYSI